MVELTPTCINAYTNDYLDMFPGKTQKEAYLIYLKHAVCHGIRHDIRLKYPNESLPPYRIQTLDELEFRGVIIDVKKDDDRLYELDEIFFKVLDGSGYVIESYPNDIYYITYQGNDFHGYENVTLIEATHLCTAINYYIKENPEVLE